MTVPVGVLLWAGNRPSDHSDHLHVEPPTQMRGIPPTTNPGMSPGVKVIYDALVEQFGPAAYFVNPPAGTQWTHMGGWNRRPIAGSSSWSQHSWWNALDIGPYHGMASQQRFYDFLTGKFAPPDANPGDPIVKPPAYAVQATQWHIDAGIYLEDTVDDVDEDEEFHRQTVFRHRFYTKVVAPAIGQDSGAVPQHDHEATVHLS